MANMQFYPSLEEQPMANETEQNFCLFNYESFLVISLSTKSTLEEFQNLSLPADHIPHEIITPIGLVEAEPDMFRSVVSVGSMVYCIGGSKLIMPGVHEPSNEVTKFHTCQPTFKLESCCNMIQPRESPAVVSICGKIYVFGGLPNGKENCKEFPWAEFLDTNMPESKQKWKAMKEPVFRLLEPFAIQYGAQTILIGNSRDMNQGAIIYNVADQSSLSYKFDEKTMSDAFVTAPVTLSSNNTMYWIDDMLFRAYELDTHIHYKASMRAAFPYFDGLFSSPLQGPVLVHLKDDFFNMFTMFGNADSYPKTTGILECTKLRVTKCRLKSGEGVLQVDRVGHQSYQCESMWTLCGALPIVERQRRIQGNRQRRRQRKLGAQRNDTQSDHYSLFCV